MQDIKHPGRSRERNSVDGRGASGSDELHPDDSNDRREVERIEEVLCNPVRSRVERLLRPLMPAKGTFITKRLLEQVEVTVGMELRTRGVLGGTVHAVQLGDEVSVHLLDMSFPPNFLGESDG